MEEKGDRFIFCPHKIKKNEEKDKKMKKKMGTKKWGQGQKNGKNGNGKNGDNGKNKKWGQIYFLTLTTLT